MSIRDKYTVRSIATEETKEWLLYKHYAKRTPSISYAFGLFNEHNILSGVCTFGMPPTPFFSKLFENGTYVELNRLVISDGLDKNVLSFFVSRCIKALGNMIIVSYADANMKHNGYIYQATNWIYTGLGRVDQNDLRGVNRFYFGNKEFHERHIPETMAAFNFKIDNNLTKNENWVANGGKIIKQERKHRYFYVTGNNHFVKKNEDIIKNHFIIYPYPKGDNQRYDASYKPTIQTSLF